MTHPIQAAVEPLRAAAIDRAEKDALAFVARVEAKLAAAGGDLNVAAPIPKDIWARDYRPCKQLHAAYASLVRSDPNRTNRMRVSDPYFVVIDPDRVAKFVANAKDQASFQYDLFVAKLTRKAEADGRAPVVEASLYGNHVWGRSTLTITHSDGAVTRWMTQQIVNVSVLGKIFNQWPTRLCK